MLLKIEPAEDVPLYRQIAAAIRRAIRHGEVVEGDRLPATRELAKSLGVNMHTVLRAYALLRDEGLVELRRGRGAIVLEGSSDTAVVRHLVAELAKTARHLGMRAEEVIQMVRKELS
jgi:DNA-binding transcriptional regulator YhcF (GntR family)